VIDTTAAARFGAGRWHAKGEHTLYLASDRGVAVAEFARHLRTRYPPEERELRDRFIFQIDVGIHCVVDLRVDVVCRQLSLPTDPAWIRDLEATRRVARGLRQESPAQAIIVPSMAFLDDPERWNMVIFREKLPTYPEPFLTDVRQVGTIRPAELLGIVAEDLEGFG